LHHSDWIIHECDPVPPAVPSHTNSASVAPT
jgi:hypothetical protein